MSRPPRARAVPEGRTRGCVVPVTALLLLAYLAYLALGTSVFWALEGPAAHKSDLSFQRDKWALLQNFTCLDGPALDSLIRNIIQAYKNGAHLFSNTTSMGRWELVGSFFFSVSTITTIGYGNLSPQTMAARLFCIFFALVGIPLNLVVLNRLGHLMQRVVHRCARRMGGAWQDPAKARWLAGSSALLSGLLLFLLLPPLLFSHMEGWSYVEGFYFAFITLSTVGFGDYVIGQSVSPQRATSTESQKWAKVHGHAPPQAPGELQNPPPWLQNKEEEIASRWQCRGILHPDRCDTAPCPASGSLSTGTTNHLTALGQVDSEPSPEPKALMCVEQRGGDTYPSLLGDRRLPGTQP